MLFDEGSQSLRLLIVVHGYPPEQTGGAERRAARTAVEMARRGHEVRVLTACCLTGHPGGFEYEDSCQDGVLVRRLQVGAPNDRSAFQASYDNPITERAVLELLSDWRPDLVHLFSGYLMSASVVRAVKSFAIPLVISLTDYWWLCHRITLIRTSGELCDGPAPVACARCQAETYRRYRLPAKASPRLAGVAWKALGQRRGVLAQLERAEMLMALLNQADALIAPSQYLADFYIRHGAPSDRLHVQRQGVELAACHVRRPSNTLRVGYLGQVKRHKGVDVLLDAWEQLRGDQARSLTIYGSSRGEPDYGRMISDRVAGLDQCSWPGEYQGVEVWKILAGLDVIVVPSRWVENSPNTILEAQAVGVPVVGSNLGGVAEMIIHEQNGLLFDVDSPADLALQLQRLLDEPQLVQHLRRSPLPFRSVACEIDRLVEVYRGSLAGT